MRLLQDYDLKSEATSELILDLYEESLHLINYFKNKVKDDGFAESKHLVINEDDLTEIYVLSELILNSKGLFSSDNWLDMQDDIVSENIKLTDEDLDFIKRNHLEFAHTDIENNQLDYFRDIWFLANLAKELLEILKERPLKMLEYLTYTFKWQKGQ